MHVFMCVCMLLRMSCVYVFTVPIASLNTSFFIIPTLLLAANAWVFLRNGAALEQERLAKQAAKKSRLRSKLSGEEQPPLQSADVSTASDTTAQAVEIRTSLEGDVPVTVTAVILTTGTRSDD